MTATMDPEVTLDTLRGDLPPVPPICDLSGSRSSVDDGATWEDVCPGRFADWSVTRYCGCCVVLLCTPCKERWQSYGTVRAAVRL